MRSMSFMHTVPQMRARTKTVTRRLGWSFLKPGDRVRAVVKAQGLKKGEKQEPIGVIEVVSVRRERLNEIEPGDVPREGFHQFDAFGFVRMFCDHMNCMPDAWVNRIEFRHVEEGS